MRAIYVYTYTCICMYGQRVCFFCKASVPTFDSMFVENTPSSNTIHCTIPRCINYTFIKTTIYIHKNARIHECTYVYVCIHTCIEWLCRGNSALRIRRIIHIKYKIYEIDISNIPIKTREIVV